MDSASDSDDDGLSPGPADKDLVVIVYVHGQVRLGGSSVPVLQNMLIPV